MNMNMRNVVLILVIVMLASFLLAGVLGATVAPFWGHSVLNLNMESVDETFEFPLEGLSAIEAETVNTEINIIPVEGDTVKVHLYGEATEGVLQEEFARLSGSRLTVSVRPRSGRNVNTQLRLTLDMYVPAKYTETLRADTVSGNMKVTELHLKDLEFKTVSGDLTASNMEADRFQFTSVSGNLHVRLFRSEESDFKSTSGDFDASGFTGDITARTVSGNLEVEYSEFDYDVSLDTTSGNTKLTLPEDSQFSVSLSTVSGKVNSEFPITVHATSRSGFEGNVGEEDNEIEVKSVSGDVNLYQK